MHDYLIYINFPRNFATTKQQIFNIYMLHDKNKTAKTFKISR